MSYFILTLIGCLWFAKARQYQLNRKNITPVDIRGTHTAESIKASFVEYWKDRMEELETPKEQGELLYRASKTDGILDQIFNPSPPKLTEEQLVERAKNVVPLHPPK